MNLFLIGLGLGIGGTVAYARIKRKWLWYCGRREWLAQIRRSGVDL